MRRFAVVMVLTLVAGLAWPARSFATPESDARDLFTQATQALESGDASLARDLLQRAIAMHPSLPAYFNLAVALRRAGQVLEAVSVLDELLRGDHGALSSEQHEAAERQRERTREDLATIVLDYAPGPVDVRTSIDGAAPVPLDPTTRALLANPGTHRIEVHARGYEFDRVEVNAVRASTVRASVAFHAAALSPRAVAGNGVGEGSLVHMPDREERGISPWWFVASGAVVVAVVVIAVVLLAPASSDANADATFTALTP